MLYAVAMPLQIRTCSLGKWRSDNTWHCRINVVKKPKSYWGEGNIMYTELNVTFTFLILTPFYFLGKEARMHGDTCQAVFCCYLVWVLFRAKLLMGGRSPSSAPFYECACSGGCIGYISHPGAWLSSQKRFVMEQHGSTPACTPRCASPRFSPWGLPNPCSKPFPEGYSHPL